MSEKPTHRYPSHLRRRHKLRQTATKPEQLLWAAPRNRRFAGLKFRRQSSLGPSIVDFICSQRNLIIELDGDYHEYVAEADRSRQRYFEANGYLGNRFSNEEVLHDVDAVMRAIAKALRITSQG